MEGKIESKSQESNDTDKKTEGRWKKRKEEGKLDVEQQSETKVKRR